MYQYQLDLFQTPAKKVIINKSRQLGISDFYAFKTMLNAMAGRPNLIVSPAERQSGNFSFYAQAHFENLLPYLDHNPLKRQSFGYMEFESGGYLRSLPNSPTTIRGIAIPANGTIVLDEFAHFSDAEKIWQAVYPMATRGGDIVVISTPYGEANLFADYWRKADELGFEKRLINYRQCETMTDSMVTELRRTIDELSWRQEYENEFLAMKESYFSMDLINKSVDKSITLWTEPEQLSEGGKLMFLVDVGRKVDKTAILGVDTLGRVLFKKTMERTEYQDQFAVLCALLPHATVMKIDKNGIGNQLAEDLGRVEPGVVQGVAITNELKEKSFIELRRMMEAKPPRVWLPDDFEIKRALNLIQRKQYGTTITFEAHRDDTVGHADCAFALMLLVGGTGERPLKVEWVRREGVPAGKVERMRTLGLRFSSGLERPFAAVLGVQYVGGDWRVGEAVKERLSFPMQVTRARDLMAQWKPARVFVDAESYQNILRQKVALPVLPCRVGGNSEMQIMNMAPYFEQGRVVLGDGVTAEFLREWGQFPDLTDYALLEGTVYALNDLLLSAAPMVKGVVVAKPPQPATLPYIKKYFHKVV